MELPKVLTDISDAYQRILEDNLCGIYVHGSLAFGCFHPAVSDIDFLVVIYQDISQEQKEAMILALCALQPSAPPKGFEMSVVLYRDCQSFSYPTPFLLHYSNAHIGHIKSNLSDYCRTMHGTDADLAAHFTVIRHTGIVLYGKPIVGVFGDVPMSDYLRSIQADIENAEIDIEDNPVYITLNLCRVLAYVKDGLVLSKSEGGKWGVIHLPKPYHSLIQMALNAYTTGQEMVFDLASALAFAAYMKSQIFGDAVCG